MMRKRLSLLLRYSLIICVCIIMIFPVYFMLVNSFMSRAEVIETYSSVISRSIDEQAGFLEYKIIPDTISLNQYYQTLLRRADYLVMFWNSVKLVIPVVTGQILVACLAAYAFAKIRFFLRDTLFFLFIIVMLMPYQVTLVANYITIDKLKLLDTGLAVIVPGIFSAFGVFVLRQFMALIPDVYLESARIDGAGYLRTFTYIILPQSVSGITSAAILIFIDNWNMVEQPLIFLRNTFSHPMSIVMTKIINENIAVAFVAGILYMMPVVLISLRWQQQLLNGIQLSGIK